MHRAIRPVLRISYGKPNPIRSLSRPVVIKLRIESLHGLPRKPFLLVLSRLSMTIDTTV